MIFWQNRNTNSTGMELTMNAAMTVNGCAVIVCENRWVLGLLDTWRRDGARLIADGGISPSNVVA